MNILGFTSSPKIHTAKINLVDHQSEGFVWKVPKLTAQLMRVKDMHAKQDSLTPLIEREVGNRLSILA